MPASCVCSTTSVRIGRLKGLDRLRCFDRIEPDTRGSRLRAPTSRGLQVEVPVARASAPNRDRFPSRLLGLPIRLDAVPLSRTLLAIVTCYFQTLQATAAAPTAAVNRTVADTAMIFRRRATR